MEEFFQFDQYSPRPVIWTEEEALPENRSAFVRYADGLAAGCLGSKRCCPVKSNSQNVNKRMIEFLRRSWSIPVMEDSKEYERERCFQHMISERMRRQKQKNSYSALHSLLPPATRSDKNSIVLAAAKEVAELRKYKEELEGRNREVEAILAAREVGRREGAKIRLRVANPCSGIESVVEVLKCMKKMGTKNRAIQCKISAEELSALLEIESEVESAQVEKAVQRTLFEVERKLRVRLSEETPKLAMYLDKKQDT